MIDLVDNVRDFLKDAGYENVTTKRLDETTGREGVVVRRVPYTVSERYYTRTKAINYTYQVIVRQRSEFKAMQMCEEIAQVLEDAYIPSENGSYEFVGQETYTEPQELDLGESGFFVWEVRITAQIYVKGKDVENGYYNNNYNDNNTY